MRAGIAAAAATMKGPIPEPRPWMGALQRPAAGLSRRALTLTGCHPSWTACSAGLPVLANDHPVLRWMVGEGGACIDMGREGALAEFLAQWTPERIARHAEEARRRADRVFSKGAVIGRYVDYYEKVIG